MNKLLNALKAEDFDEARVIINSQTVNLDEVDEDGNTALMLCSITKCRPGEESIMNLLLDNNANTNIVDLIFKRNPLMAILELDRPQIIKRLIALTDLTIRDNENQGVLTRAIFHGKQDVIDLICKTAKTTEDIQEFSSQLIFPNHSLTPYAQNLLNKIKLNFSLDDSLLTREIKTLKNKI